MEELKNEDLKDVNLSVTENQNIFDYNTLTDDQKKKVDEIEKNISTDNASNVIQYAVGVQSDLANFSDKMIENVKSKDSGYVGEILNNLMSKVKETDVNGMTKSNPLSNIPILGKLVDEVKRFMARYEKLEVQIDQICDKLDQERMILLKDIIMFDNLFEKNVEYINELDLYIIAANKKVEDIKNNDLPKLEEKASQTNDPLDAQKVADLKSFIDRFEKKVYDLKLSRTIAIQTAPQIRFIQGGNKVLVEKIQSSILNTIPLWKSQIVIAIGILRQKGALELQKKVTDTTNNLLKQNSEMLKQNTIEVAKESEKGIVEIETLQKVNEDLITTLNETIRINDEGKQKRAEAEVELTKIEKDLREKLVNIKKA